MKDPVAYAKLSVQSNGSKMACRAAVSVKKTAEVSAGMANPEDASEVKKNLTFWKNVCAYLAKRYPEEFNPTT